MSTIQNLKNFIRHGKQARQSNSPHAEATTNVSNVHAHQQQRHNNHNPQPNHQVGVTEPNVIDHTSPRQLDAGAAGGFSMAPGNNQNQAARAGDVAAKAVEDNQKISQAQQYKDAASKQKDFDPTVLERIVAEERESKGKLPRYPGLDRWQLQEKMGDGAFSNVYRAKDLQGQYNEVAIKVVRKFEMNSSQVSLFCSRFGERPFLYGSRLVP